MNSTSALMLATVAVALGAGEANARPDTRTMTCAQVQTMVQQYNAIVMSTGPNTYARIVKGQGYCEIGQTTQRLTAPAIDTKKCAVGYVCRDPYYD